MEIILAVTGLLVGALAAWWWQHLRLRERLAALATTREEAATLRGRLDELLASRDTLTSQCEALRQELQSATAAKAGLETRAAELDRQLAGQLAETTKLQEEMRQRFELLARKLLDETSQKFHQHNATRMEEIVGPLQRSLVDFKGKVEQAQKEQTDYHGQLKNELSHLREANLKITGEAENLIRALKGDSKTQGAWGEMILETLLEKSGLTKGVEYDVQVSFTDERETERAGQRLRPDVVVYYPEQKGCLVIDAKVSLTAYEKYCSSENEEDRKQAARDHLLSMRSHIKGLAGRAYHQLKGFNSPDFVLLFIPIEPALGLAQQQDATLYEDAFSRNIVLITPSTLLATLKLVRHLWTQERQNKNALEIADRGGKLYDKFVTLFEEVETLSQQITRTATSCDKVKNLIRDGNGNLLGQVEKLRNLGAKASKSLPASESGELSLPKE